MLQNLFRRVSRPLTRVLLRTVSLRDPWQRFPLDVPLACYGAGATHDFAWYLTGTSRVRVHTLDDLLSWLRDCQYRRDPDLFLSADYWQHPLTFEQIRQGDCEDFALWTWRKLLELGFEAEFVTGRCRSGNNTFAGHAWIHIHHDGPCRLFDPVLCRHTRPLFARDDLRGVYCPEVSVDRDLTRYAYAGYFLHAFDGSSSQP
ncbi:MAG: hypothetical protein KatS3mg044_1419 [Rhodothermaceae bacterium]|nr:MAG: hypothetical protein D6746_11835 [Bacteroidota bacterium]GIV62553.1 MAG: hypothetical protein KatS3mg044_1419 [Rhodothermaceae bacterium]